ncbi:unnamed protein product [Mesocestoides corti]|uniref:Tubulin-specific chaperone A n=1 Tax=Mesocestoides corti TaxID=53468 RepID=A0A0R3U4X7_MESCO|nr:unnamed protein product [Mesocestoides corti]
MSRISKEKLKYEEELTDLQRSLEEKKASGVDEYTIKKVCELIDETKMVVSDCSRRLTEALSDLEGTLASCEDLSEHENYQAAKSVALEQGSGDA